MDILFTKKSLETLKTDVAILSLFCSDNPKKSPLLQKNDGGKALDNALNGFLTQEIERQEFSGEEEKFLIFPTQNKIPAAYIVILGLGTKNSATLDTYRQAGGKLAKIVNHLKATAASFVMEPGKIGNFQATDRLQALVEGIELADYNFDQYKNKNDRKKRTFKNLEVSVSSNPTSFKKSAEMGAAIASATKMTRDLVNTPPNDLSPTLLAKAAETVAKQNKISCKVLTQQEMKKEKMGALLAVAQGSKEPAAFVHLTYKPKKKSKVTIALVGKGITFDSGGLNIKKSDMETMKFDMAGAGTVVGVFSALAALRPNVQVDGFITSAENMPSGTAYRPGDIIYARNGKTIEVTNTDAEGRLALADALSYASDRNPTYLIDAATLTGGAARALGEKVTPLLGNDPKLISLLRKFGEEAGEPNWELPLFWEYKKNYKKTPADIKNSGGVSQASCILGGLFLEEFINPGQKWVHMDIASTAWIDYDHELKSYQQQWATGNPVNTLLRFITSF